MKIRWGKKTVALLAVAAGAVLFVFESPDLGPASSGETYFWLVIAALAMLLGMVELLSKSPPGKL